MDPSAEQLDADASAAAAAAAQAEVARAAAQAEADAKEKAEKAAENAATLAGILSSFPRHLIFFEGKSADNDIVFNPQVNPSLQLRLWQEKSVSFPYFEDLLLPWEGYLYGILFIC